VHFLVSEVAAFRKFDQNKTDLVLPSAPAVTGSAKQEPNQTKNIKIKISRPNAEVYR
jgi:hypothetical protein